MNTSLTLGSALALLLVSGVSSAATHKFTATMTGAQEAPTAVVTTATGTADITFDDASGKVSGELTFKDLHLANDNVTQMCTASHIHTGAVGVAGAPIVTFTCAAGKITFTDLVVPPGEVANLLAGNTYVNVHSGKHAGGEIRGQLLKQIADGGTEAGIVDSGADTGTPGSSGSSGTSGTSGSSGASGTTSGGTSGSNGATTTPVDAGSSGDSGSSDDGGCSSTGSSNTSNGLAMVGLAGLGLAIIMRSRKKR